MGSGHFSQDAIQQHIVGIGHQNSVRFLGYYFSAPLFFSHILGSPSSFPPWILSLVPIRARIPCKATKPLFGNHD